MLSRRSIRIKIMQLLYALDRDKVLTYEELLRQYRERIAQSLDLYLFSLSIFLDIVAHAAKDANKRHSKHLVEKQDRDFRPYLESNPLIQSLRENEILGRQLRKERGWPEIDDDVIRRLYYQFAKTEEYLAYATMPAPTNEDHQKQLLSLFKSCVNNEAYTDNLEYNYHNWIDDKSLIIGAMKKTIKGLPVAEDYLTAFEPNDETTEDFGLQLLKYVHKEDEKLGGHILPTLKNWDADRVAVLDMILLKLALSEFFLFSSIPTKVTLNEYVEISKLYSTEKSKDFINGILDRLMKELLASGEIKKSGRGLVE